MSERIYILKRVGKLDAHGQPLNRNWNAKRLTERSTDELIGICRGLLVDKAVSEEEAGYLKSWLHTYHGAAGSWPGNVIAARLDKIFEDGIIDPEEREDLSIFCGKWSAHRKKCYLLTCPLLFLSPNQRRRSFLPINSFA